MKSTIRHVLTLAALLLSSSSFAVDYWTTSSPVVYFSNSQSALDYACANSTPPSWAGNVYLNCVLGDVAATGVSSVTYQIRGHTDTDASMRRIGNFNVLHYTVTSCPTQLPYEWENGACHSEPEPPPECPDGQFKEGDQCVHGCVAGAEIKLVLPMEQVQSSTIDPILGCDLNLSETKKPECNFNTFMCNVYYTDSGEYNHLFDADPEYEPLPEPDPIPEPVSSEQVSGPVVDIQQNPDGSTTKTETTETTKLNDQGQTLEIIGDSIVLKNKDGEIIDILQQTTTNTYTDGSSTVTETTTTTATPSAVTEVKKNLSDGSTSVTTRTYQSGPSGTTVTTKTETFDPQGNSTGKTESTTGKIDEVGEEEEGDYSYQSPGGKDDLYEKTGKTFQGVLTNFVNEAQEAPIFSAASDFFTVSTGGTCPVWTIPSVWVFGTIVIDAQCSQVMNQIWPLIAAIVLAVAGYIAFRWAFL